MKALRSFRQLRAGFHIRAYINPYGDARIEVINVLGRPVKLKEYGGTRHWKVRYRNEQRPDRETLPYFIGDLLGHDSPGSLATCSCFAFDNTTLNKLRAAQSNLRQFFSLLNGGPVADNAWAWLNHSYLSKERRA